MIFSIQDIVESTGGNLVVAPLNAGAQATSLTWDSRRVKRGGAYVSIVGARVDGNDFAVDALRAGAAVALMSREPRADECATAQESGGAIVRVACGEDAVRALATAWRARLGATVVGVTGSVGKTTTKGLIRDVLSARFRTSATQGNYNNQLGAPATLLAADETCEMLVMEMGMDHAGEVARICQVARPHLGVITNVGLAHLEYLGTRENIARAKAELIEALPEGGTAFLQAQGEFTPFIRAHARVDERGVRTVLFGGVPGAATVSSRGAGVGGETVSASAAAIPDVYATDLRLDGKGRPHFTLHAKEEVATCSLSLRGAHNVENACAAAAVGLACEMSLDEVCAALAVAQPETGRGQLRAAACGAAVFDDTYNASPASMEAALATLAAYEVSGRRIAVLGDMGELGEAAVSGHTDTGLAAARTGLDLLICAGELARLIAQGARDAGMDARRVVCVHNADEALAALPSDLGVHDALLVKASRFMGLDRVVEGVCA